MWDHKVIFGMEPPKKEPADVREMRKAIELASNDSVLIRRAFDAAWHHGLNGEDKYTMLAYYALIELQRHADNNIEFLKSFNPVPA